MPPKTLEEIFEENEHEKAILCRAMIKDKEMDVYNPKFIKYLKSEIAFYETIISKEK